MNASDSKEAELGRQMTALRGVLRDALPDIGTAANLIRTIAFRMECEDRGEGGWPARYWSDQLRLAANAIARSTFDIHDVTRDLGWEVRP